MTIGPLCERAYLLNRNMCEMFHLGLDAFAVVVDELILHEIPHVYETTREFLLFPTGARLQLAAGVH